MTEDVARHREQDRPEDEDEDEDAVGCLTRETDALHLCENRIPLHILGYAIRCRYPYTDAIVFHLIEFVTARRQSRSLQQSTRFDRSGEHKSDTRRATS